MEESVWLKTSERTKRLYSEMQDENQKCVVTRMLRNQIKVVLKGGKCCKEVKRITEFIHLFICSLVSIGHYCVPP